MNKGNESAYPSVISPSNVEFGLTKRELLAAMAMQGILSSGWIDPGPDSDIIAIQSLRIADNLLKALEK